MPTDRWVGFGPGIWGQGRVPGRDLVTQDAGIDSVWGTRRTFSLSLHFTWETGKCLRGPVGAWSLVKWDRCVT